MTTLTISSIPLLSISMSSNSMSLVTCHNTIYLHVCPSPYHPYLHGIHLHTIHIHATHLHATHFHTTLLHGTPHHATPHHATHLHLHSPCPSSPCRDLMTLIVVFVFDICQWHSLLNATNITHTLS